MQLSSRGVTPLVIDSPIGPLFFCLYKQLLGNGLTILNHSCGGGQNADGWETKQEAGTVALHPTCVCKHNPSPGNSATNVYTSGFP
jgi:hypothetical protein